MPSLRSQASTAAQEGPVGDPRAPARPLSLGPFSRLSLPSPRPRKAKQDAGGAVGKPGEQQENQPQGERDLLFSLDRLAQGGGCTCIAAALTPSHAFADALQPTGCPPTEGSTVGRSSTWAHSLRPARPALGTRSISIDGLDQTAQKLGPFSVNRTERLTAALDPGSPRSSGPIRLGWQRFLSNFRRRSAGSPASPFPTPGSTLIDGVVTTSERRRNGGKEVLRECEGSSRAMPKSCFWRSSRQPQPHVPLDVRRTNGQNDEQSPSSLRAGADTSQTFTSDPTICTLSYILPSSLCTAFLSEVTVG